MKIHIIDKKPLLFQKTASNIWTDPHIQLQILQEHLNPDSDGASRNPDSNRKVIDFITEHIKPTSKLLDLGCGPGLYTSDLKDKGYNITGIDFNKTSIDYAIHKRNDISYITGDYIHEFPSGIYDAIIMIYCDLGTHSDNDREYLLQNIYFSLEKNGTFIFDVFTDNLIHDKPEMKSWEYAPSGGFWDKDEYVLLSQTFHYPQNRAIAYQYNLLTKNGNKHFILSDRYFHENEITEILKNIGFNKVSIHQHLLSGNNFTSNSEIFVVAEKF